MTAYVPRPGTIPTLPVPDLRAVRRAHVVGIGGAGMSGLARLLLARGIQVTGSDLKAGPALDSLRAEGARIDIGNRAEHVRDPDVVIISTAIPPTNPEVRRAEDAGIPVVMRAQALAALVADRMTVVVAGTHGKTTTTSMLAVILERAGVDPTYVIGGELNESGSNARAGKGPVAVVEADESDGSFLLFEPTVGIVTNIEVDHVDFFPGGQREIEEAFRAFCERCGSLVAFGDDPAVRRVLRGLAVPVTTYGVGAGNDARVEPEPGPAPARGNLARANDQLPLELRVRGRHVLLDAAAAILAAEAVGVDPEVAAAALESFTGVRRRFQIRGSVRGAEVVDDYAHHPSEIAATLETARGFAPRRLVAVFQPHRYSRTNALWRTLGESLGAADVVVLTDVYGANEQPMPGVTGKLLVEALLDTAPGKRVAYLPRRSDLAPYLAGEIRPGDMVLTLGAGDITMLGDELLARGEGAAA